MSRGTVSFANNVIFGAGLPTLVAGLLENDTYFQTSNGSRTGTVIAEFVFDGISWIKVGNDISAPLMSGAGVRIVGTEIRLSIGTLPHLE